MSEPMSSPGDKQPPKEWWLENACRIAAFRLRAPIVERYAISPCIASSVEEQAQVFRYLDR